MRFLQSFALITFLLVLRGGNAQEGTVDDVSSSNFLLVSDDAEPVIVSYGQGDSSTNDDRRSLSNPHYVSLHYLPMSRKAIERPYHGHDIIRKKRQSEVNNTQASSLLNDSTLDALKKTPANFTSSTVVIHYTHQITDVEKAEDTPAKLGDKCQTANILNPDPCERAAYPNKNKMVCNKVDDAKKGLKPNTCMCKFYRMEETNNLWVQMRTGTYLWNEEEVKICLVPRYGMCNHRIPTGERDILNRPVFEVDVCQGHFQCDNSAYIKDLKHNQTLTVKKHCTEEDFLEQYKSNVIEHILLCSKPHPRRFSNYDEYKYYCLPKKDRDPNLEEAE